jgi:hypothetical protein
MNGMKSDSVSERDVFACIATERYERRGNDLVAQGPAPVPRKVLPLDRKARRRLQDQARRMRTAKDLENELRRQRTRMAGYLLNHAPDLESKRKTIELKSFDWREETEKDRRDFASTISGAGAWTRVTIPHYGPPLGRAVTFYRTRFKVTRQMMNMGALFVKFRGVDYKAHVFVNGAFLGSHEGFFAPFEFDFTRHARQGMNELLVKVENDAICMGQHVGAQDLEGDKLFAATGPGYDDPEAGWHHCPPGMGIYQPVFIEAGSRVSIRDVFVRPVPDEKRAEAWVEVFNCDVENKPVRLRVSVYGRNFRQTVIRRLEYTPVSLEIRGHGDMEKFSDPRRVLSAGAGVNYFRVPLAMPGFRTWDVDHPWLYQAQVELLDGDGAVCDTAQQQFGMRSFRQDEKSKPRGKFYLNGREVKLRGANTMGHEQQCVMRGDFSQLVDDILLARICHMNFLRLTQRPVQKEVYEYCDRLGMMTQTDLPLFGCLRRNQMCEAVRQAGEMERLVRPHACNVLVSYVNEPFPNAMGKPHRHLTRPELEDFFEMADRVVRQANPDRVIKWCDGDYDPPAPAHMPDNHCYCGWYLGQGVDLGKLNHGHWMQVKPGWHYGCGEFGAEGLDNLPVMRKYYPESWLPKPGDPPAAWRPGLIRMSQTERFHHVWYETPGSLEDWIKTSQAHQAWIARMMTEAYRRDARMNTFAWHLFIDAWPAGWMKTLMDVDRQPKQAYFAYRDALTPLMVSLRSDRWNFWSGETAEFDVWVCNDTHERVRGARLVYQMEWETSERSRKRNVIVYSGETQADIAACAPKAQGRLRFKLPEVNERCRAVVRLTLCAAGGSILHESMQTLEIHTRLPVLPERRAYILGGRHGRAAALAKEMGLISVLGAPQAAALHGIRPCARDVILCEDPAVYARCRGEVDKAVAGGAVAVLLEWPEGEYAVGGDVVKVERGGIGPRFFVSRATGHPLVAGLQPNDVKFWCDESVGYATPLLSNVVDPVPARWQMVLETATGNWQEPWHKAGAVMEKKAGGGCYRICQVALTGRTRFNPVAALFARRLLQ